MMKLTKEEYNIVKGTISRLLSRHLKIDRHYLDRASFIGLMYRGHIFEIKNRYLNIPTENYMTIEDFVYKYSSQPVVNLMVDVSYSSDTAKDTLDEFINNIVIVEPVY